MIRPATAARYLLLTAIGAVLTGALLSPLVAFAAEPPALIDIDMSVAVGRDLSAVTTLMDAGQLAEASAALQPLRNRAEQGQLNDYEKFRVLQTAGRLNTAQQKYQEAIADFEAMLLLPSVPEADRVATLDVTGQLYLQLANWDKGLEYLLQVNESQAGSNMETLFRIAFAYSQLEQTAEAIPYMEQALVVGADRAGEAYYSNMVVLYTAAKDYPKAIATMEVLLRRFPDSANVSGYRQDLDALKRL